MPPVKEGGEALLSKRALHSIACDNIERSKPPTHTFTLYELEQHN